MRPRKITVKQRSTGGWDIVLSSGGTLPKACEGFFTNQGLAVSTAQAHLVRKGVDDEIVIDARME